MSISPVRWARRSDGGAIDTEFINRDVNDDGELKLGILGQTYF
jgi:hypothetical protein